MPNRLVDDGRGSNGLIAAEANHLNTDPVRLFSDLYPALRYIPGPDRALLTWF